MRPMTDFLVKRDDFRECRVEEGDPPGLEAGQALLRVDSFGMTSNNVTYAVFGEAMSYWEFFPTAERGWGRLPTWGFAEVESSEAEGVEAGTRLYGYLPASSHLIVIPAAADETGFVDGSPHKAALPSAYHRYLATAADSFYRPGTEEVQMLLRPLFFTSFLIDDQLDDEDLATRGPVVLSSASSKTAIAAAFLLAQRDDVELVGLTGGSNAEFVEGLGLYDRTVPYDAVDTLERGPATYVAISGDGDVRRAVHSQNGCQASATRFSSSARPQSSARLRTLVGAKKKAGRGPGRSPAPSPISSQCVAPTAMLWARSSPKCAWTARRTSPSPEMST